MILILCKRLLLALQMVIVPKLSKDSPGKDWWKRKEGDQNQKNTIKELETCALE